MSGKGVEAAIVTATARHAFRENALRADMPSDMLRAANRTLRDQRSERYCTAAIARLVPAEGGRWTATIATGGHPYPLHIRPGEATPTGCPGSLVGALESVSFGDVTLDLVPGDVLLLYTDGVTEARRQRAFYGDERLRTVAAPCGTAEAVVDAVLHDVLEYQDQRTSDDVVLVAIGVP